MRCSTCLLLSDKFSLLIGWSLDIGQNNPPPLRNRNRVPLYHVKPHEDVDPNDVVEPKEWSLKLASTMNSARLSRTNTGLVWGSVI